VDGALRARFETARQLYRYPPVRNTSTKPRDSAAESIVRVRDLRPQARGGRQATEADKRRFAPATARGVPSKFDACLP
jgi:hypothetical protein